MTFGKLCMNTMGLLRTAVVVVVQFAIVQGILETEIVLQDNWKDGRSTYFGADGYSIHKGSCGFGYQFENVYPGFDVIAISDKSSQFANSCGKCFEVRCREEAYTDGYNNEYDGMVCHNTTESLVVRVVDACPCQYAPNAYSNKRWCCQDQGAGEMHADMSVWAFEKLGSKAKGSMAVAFREVPCNYMPVYPAYARGPATKKDTPPRTARLPHELTYIKRTDEKGLIQGAVNQIPKGEEPWAEPLPGDMVYTDGTFNGSWGGLSAIKFVSEAPPNTNLQGMASADGDAVATPEYADAREG